MQEIVCASCGSKKITIQDGKGICEACGRMFNIHNHSEEFEKTASAIEVNTKKIIKEFKENQSLKTQEVQNYDRLLEKAQTYFQLRDRKNAVDCATKAIIMVS